jgi:hypothetical protein
MFYPVKMWRILLVFGGDPWVLGWLGDSLFPIQFSIVFYGVNLFDTKQLLFNQAIFTFSLLQ